MLSFLIVLWGQETTQLAAHTLGRRFIGADINLGSVQTILGVHTCITLKKLIRIKQTKRIKI